MARIRVGQDVLIRVRDNKDVLPGRVKSVTHQEIRFGPLYIVEVGGGKRYPVEAGDISPAPRAK